MTKTLKLVLLATLTVSSAAHATTWQKVSESSTGMITYVDLDSIRTNGSVRRVWIKYDMSKVKTEKARFSKEQADINCYERTVTKISYIDTAADGSVIKSRTIPEVLREADPAAPETVGDAIVTQVCP